MSLGISKTAMHHLLWTIPFEQNQTVFMADIKILRITTTNNIAPLNSCLEMNLWPKLHFVRTSRIYLLYIILQKWTKFPVFQLKKAFVYTVSPNYRTKRSKRSVFTYFLTFNLLVVTVIRISVERVQLLPIQLTYRLQNDSFSYSLQNDIKLC